jgi:hypothetical protein
VSESESEDEDMVPKAICGSVLSQRSPVATSEDKGHLLAIEADPHREKVFRIATELLTTERNYVAVLHLIDQVITHGACLSHLGAEPLDVFITVVPPMFSAPYFVEKLWCADFQFVAGLAYFLALGEAVWSLNVIKKSLCSVLKKVGCLCY